MLDPKGCPRSRGRLTAVRSWGSGPSAASARSALWLLNNLFGMGRVHLVFESTDGCVFRSPDGSRPRRPFRPFRRLERRSWSFRCTTRDGLDGLDGFIHKAFLTSDLRGDADAAGLAAGVGRVGSAKNARKREAVPSCAGSGVASDWQVVCCHFTCFRRSIISTAMVLAFLGSPFERNHSTLRTPDTSFYRNLSSTPSHDRRDTDRIGGCIVYGSSRWTFACPTAGCSPRVRWWAF